MLPRHFERAAIIELYISNKHVCKGMLLYLTFPRRFHLHLLPCHKIVLFYMYATQNWIKSLYVLQHFMQDSRCRSRKVSIRSSIHPLPGRLKLRACSTGFFAFARPSQSVRSFKGYGVTNLYKPKWARQNCT